MNPRPSTRRGQRFWSLPKVYVALIVVALLGCKPSAEEEAKKAARLKVEAARQEELCRDRSDCGEKPPAGLKVDYSKHALRKWNNHWFLVPRDYNAAQGMGFLWPLERARAKGPNRHDPNVWAIELHIRSYDIPSPPFGYDLIDDAERAGRVIKRETIRPGLDRVEFVSLHPFTGERAPQTGLAVVATTRRDSEGRPPVLGCRSDPLTRERGGGGTVFMWREGIFVEVLIRKGPVCEDWPELFDEVIRVLNLTQKL